MVFLPDSSVNDLMLCVQCQEDMRIIIFIPTLGTSTSIPHHGFKRQSMIVNYFELIINYHLCRQVRVSSLQ